MSAPLDEGARYLAEAGETDDEHRQSELLHKARDRFSDAAARKGNPFATRGWACPLQSATESALGEPSAARRHCAEAMDLTTDAMRTWAQEANTSINRVASMRHGGKVGRWIWFAPVLGDLVPEAAEWRHRRLLSGLPKSDMYNCLNWQALAIRELAVCIGAETPAPRLSLVQGPNGRAELVVNTESSA